jgi:hypothetical protein
MTPKDSTQGTTQAPPDERQHLLAKIADLERQLAEPEDASKPRPMPKPARADAARLSWTSNLADIGRSGMIQGASIRRPPELGVFSAGVRLGGRGESVPGQAPRQA